jgi:hypothetical protein
MANYQVLPDILDIAFNRGDEFALLVTADRDLTGYTFEASTYYPGVSPTSEGQTVVLPSIADGRFVTAFTVEEADLPAGKINLRLNEVQTNLFVNGGIYRWYLRWTAPGDITRTAISGSLIAVNP